MGFDVYGEKPKSKTGIHFRNNIWWWHPLWYYVCNVCSDCLSEEIMNMGGGNNGVLVNEEIAMKLHSKLISLIDSGETQKYKIEYVKLLKSYPLVVCEHCNGTGQRNDEYVKGSCNGCDGKGKCKDRRTSYQFEVENIKEFAEFCKYSGGFTIC